LFAAVKGSGSHVLIAIEGLNIFFGSCLLFGSVALAIRLAHKS
jgi:hypothetical protein